MKIIEPLVDFWIKTSERLDNNFNEFLEKQNPVIKYSLKVPYDLVKNYWDLGAIMLSAYSLRDISAFGEYGKYVFPGGLILGLFHPRNEYKSMRNFVAFFGTFFHPSGNIEEIATDSEKLTSMAFAGFYYLNSAVIDYAGRKNIDLFENSLEDKVTE